MNQFLVEVTVYLYPQIIDVYVYDVGIRIKVLDVYKRQSLEKATQLYQSTNMDLERNFEKLITGVNENFTRKNISLLEFIDYRCV